MPSNAASRSATHYVAPIEETPLQAVDQVDENEKTRSTWTDAWDSMRVRPMFWVSAVLILLIIVVALFPGLFTHIDPRKAILAKSNEGSEAGHIFGYNRQGYDVYSRVIWGARNSLIVGIVATVLVTIVGVIIGALAGFYGGWLDTIVSRIADIFFSIPTVLGAIVIMSVIPARNAITVALVLAAFAWPQIARIMRGAVLSAKQSDYVMASAALGVSRFKTLVRHVIPNSVAPVIVVSTVSLGTFIVAEATLSFLGIGLPDSALSWGLDIGTAQVSIRTAPSTIFWPSAALSITVLAFLLLGDVVRDALDPKARARR
ncbi:MULTISPECIES: ABC transporter permease [Curtobacterium]|uniref:ABC transporter permease n=1 Tax=Curtobacterium TaxID=2034 RepID=UPI000DA98971|nr:MULTISPECIES: ABC transporter permease [Curtobacterium]MBO9041865.1 ABC transporter permease [Curtobacterium flaccumfaciens pv. flaccumfaciens]MBO9049706.1 ABC transporter permease [Curtobacterium flaccumfaciens pv. flaccumfaciens]MBT1683867.1 ABC transporter permease [Curtobacterium flaccumfaciens pv. flaccumfaciens]MCS6550651.1 ABC transporter permease [Curtobacterium flaccumfaciens pv. flaccumfaciens]PZE69922.1 ABC transporter permease [Curtobacterium sp. MCLR17_059]